MSGKRRRPRSRFAGADRRQWKDGDPAIEYVVACEKLLGCLEQLPLPQRSAFLLHHDDGLALEEVANALEVGFETAKTRLRYAMSKLRTCMGAYLEPLQQRGSS